jgi:hypothetical protein
MAAAPAAATIPLAVAMNLRRPVVTLASSSCDELGWVPSATSLGRTVMAGWTVRGCRHIHGAMTVAAGPGPGYHELGWQDHVVEPLAIAASPALGSRGALPAVGAHPKKGLGGLAAAQEYSELEISGRLSRWCWPLSDARAASPHSSGRFGARARSARRPGHRACGRMSPRCDRCPSSSVSSPRAGGRTSRRSST